MNNRIRRRASPVVTLLSAVVLSLPLAVDLDGQEESAPAPGLRGWAALVGEEVITYGDLDKRVDALFAQLKEPNPNNRARQRLHRQFLDYLVEESLLLQEAKRQEITVDEQEVLFRINEEIKRLREQGQDVRDAEDLYQLLLESRNISKEEYRKDMEKAILIEKLLWTKVFPTREFISPGERREYYHTHRKEFQTPSKITFRQIFLPIGTASREIVEVINKALDEGRDFADLARKFSDSELDLWTKRIDEISSWPRPLPEILKKMKPGEMRRAVESSRGTHFLKMESIEMGEAQSFEKVQESIEKKIRYFRREKKKIRFVERLKSRFIVKNFLAEQTPSAEKPGKKGKAVAVDGPRKKDSLKDVSPDQGKAKKKSDEPEKKPK